ncbi:glycoside hydrolase family 30 protein [Pontibacter chitinilyticus]|uniref:glycoside hydrolase family 30 protein n=1 Tax=Pontibacter chitinilyticus TaxID=2674989 RepID=UPI00321C1B13
MLKSSVRLPLGLLCAALLLGSCQQKLATAVDLTSTAEAKESPAAVSWWLTTPDGAALLSQQAALSFKERESTNSNIIVDDSKTYQTMDGFGYTLTGGSAQVLHQMSPAARAALLKELFGTGEKSIGISYLRVSIGASDLNDHVFSYDDLPAGQTDSSMAHFSLDPDREALIPVLKEILDINPAIKILGSPWSAPVWMKTNHDTRGGSLKPEYQEAYARYFVRYIQEMKAEGIPIDAVTIQNEPLHPGNNPSMLMLPEQQKSFIKQNLGPAFKAANINTKILLYDHNLDRPDYPISILDDPEARQYVDGSAFHLYAGTIDVMSQVHDAYPDKKLYFTEQWVSSDPGTLEANLDWHIRNLIIGAPRNWSSTVLEWNLAADQNQEPHTDRGGCNMCLGALTIAGEQVTRNPAYYIIAQASKFVRPGAVRIASTMPESLPNVAYKTPAGNKVLIVLNANKASQTVTFSNNGRSVSAALPGGAVGTFVW